MLIGAAENTFSVRWVGGWLLGLIGIKAQLPAKLKLKLNLSLAISM